MAIQKELPEIIEIFPWNRNFETGIAIIDEQHRKLVAILNRLALDLAKHAAESELNVSFKALVDYADEHFRTEEGIWSQYLEDDDVFRKHVETHHAFLADILAMKQNEGHKTLDETVYDVVTFLSKWLVYHILEDDMRLAKTVQAIRSGTGMNEAKRIADSHMDGRKKLLVDTVLGMYEKLSAATMDLLREKAMRLKAEGALTRSEERWQVMLEDGAENVWDWDIADNTVTRSENEPLLFEFRQTGLSAGKEVTVHPADIPALQRDFESHLRGETDFFTGKYRILRENGSWKWILTRSKVVSRGSDGRPLRMIGIHSDISEHELAAQIYHASSQAMVICDMNNKIISINPAFTAVTGYALDEIAGEDPKLLGSGRHDKAFFREMWQAILTRGHWKGEFYNRRKNGEIYPVFMVINTVRGKAGKIDHYFAIFDDITEKRQTEKLIYEQANFDPLTKLPNRRRFLARLKEEVKESERIGVPFALLFIDLDNFKEINDTLGHETGDLVLIEVSQRMVRRMQRSDPVSHLGGDKFAVLLYDVKELRSVETAAEDLLRLLKKPFRLGENTLHISVSIGISLYPYDGADASTLLKHAEQAMYLAKQMGRARYSYFTASMQQEAQKRRRLRDDLYRAMDAGELEVFYQPIVDLQTRRMHKAEALLRWHHPRRGMIPPDEFIPLAEESGLIVAIGDWVYREATRRAREWMQRYDASFQISINKSPVQFRTPHTVEEWMRHLEAIGLPGRNSVIEITENALMQCEAQVLEKLTLLREHDVQISLDDFGTGYSSLSYLQKFKIDYVKIDKSFVSSLNADNSRDATLCEAIVTMAHKLDIRVIAEGVETPYQYELLRAMKCDYGQGFLFSPPVSAADFETLMKKGVFEVATFEK